MIEKGPRKALWQKVIDRRDEREKTIATQRETIEHGGRAIEELTTGREDLSDTTRKQQEIIATQNATITSQSDALADKDIEIGKLSDIQIMSTHEARKTIGRRESEAGTDPLTGLPNRRQFVSHMKSVSTILARDNQFLSVLFIDIDKFKEINDLYGHDAGDIALRAIADELKRIVPGDNVARWGGEEFVVLLPKADQKAASRRAEEIRNAISQLRIKLPDKEIQKTTSIGLSTERFTRELIPDISTHIDTLLRAADKAVYKAKDGGRNRVEV